MLHASRTLYLWLSDHALRLVKTSTKSAMAKILNIFFCGLVSFFFFLLRSFKVLLSAINLQTLPRCTVWMLSREAIQSYFA